MITSGWGFIAPNGPQPTKLMVTTVKGLSNTECQARYPNKIIGPYNICAEKAPGITCNGDSGGKFVK